MNKDERNRMGTEEMLNFGYEELERRLRETSKPELEALVERTIGHMGNMIIDYKDEIQELNKDIDHVQKSLDHAHNIIANICDYDMTKDIPLTSIIKDVDNSLNKEECISLRHYLNEILDVPNSF